MAMSKSVAPGVCRLTYLTSRLQRWHLTSFVRGALPDRFL
jgi:hypothetical protein